MGLNNHHPFPLRVPLPVTSCLTVIVGSFCVFGLFLERRNEWRKKEGECWIMCVSVLCIPSPSVQRDHEQPCRLKAGSLHG